MKKFITQQESLVPEHRRPLQKKATVKVPKKRGRKPSNMTLKRFLLLRALDNIRRSGKRLTREEFAAVLGINPRYVNTMAAAFERTTPEVDRQNREFQDKFDAEYDKNGKVTAVPLLTPQEIMQRDFSWHGADGEREAVCIPKEVVDYSSRFHYFAFVMPDNCMLHDGICKGDMIAAIANVRPTQGDMVVCRIPGTEMITVRRYAVTCNPVIFDLYEGGTTNPMQAYEIEKLIYGTVLCVVRRYWPRRLPYKD